MHIFHSSLVSNYEEIEVASTAWWVQSKTHIVLCHYPSKNFSSIFHWYFSRGRILDERKGWTCIRVKVRGVTVFAPGTCDKSIITTSIIYKLINICCRLILSGCTKVKWTWIIGVPLIQKLYNIFFASKWFKKLFNPVFKDKFL